MATDLVSLTVSLLDIYCVGLLSFRSSLDFIKKLRFLQACVVRRLLFYSCIKQARDRGNNHLFFVQDSDTFHLVCAVRDVPSHQCWFIPAHLRDGTSNSRLFSKTLNLIISVPGI